MKAPKLLIITLSALMLIPAAYAGKEVDRLLKEYSKIETVSCRIRRTVDGEVAKIKFLSRIYYTNKDQLHVENLTPVKRRTIADGERLYQYGEGDPKGFSRPINELSEAKRIIASDSRTGCHDAFTTQGFRNCNGSSAPAEGYGGKSASGE